MKSSVPGFKAALIARLQANTAIAADGAANGGDLEVILGNPQPETAPKSIIVIGDMSNHKYDYVCAMTQANESYDVEAIVSLVDSTANDKQALVDRAYGLADMVHADMLAWSDAGFLDGSGKKAADIVLPEITSDQEFTGADAREFAVTLTLHVTARVS